MNNVIYSLLQVYIHMMNKMTYSLLAVAFLFAIVYPVRAAIAPSQMVMASFAKMASWKTFHLSGTYTLSGPSFPKNTTVFRVTSNMGDRNNPKTMVHVIPSGKYDAGIDVLLLGMDEYFNFDLGNRQSALVNALNLGKYENKWIYFNVADLSQKIFGSEFMSSTLPMPMNTGRQLTQEQMNQLTASARNNNVLKVSLAGSGSVAGESMYIFNLNVNKVGLRNFLVDANRILNQGNMDEELLEDTLNNSTHSGQVWVSKKTSYPMRLILNTSMPSMTGETGTWTSRLEMTFSNINKPVMLSKPSSYVPVEQVAADVAESLEDMMGTSAMNMFRSSTPMLSLPAVRELMR